MQIEEEEVWRLLKLMNVSAVIVFIPSPGRGEDALRPDCERLVLNFLVFHVMQNVDGSTQ